MSSTVPVANNGLVGRWAAAGATARLVEVRRIAVPREITASAAAAARVGAGGVVRIADAEAGEFIDLDPEGPVVLVRSMRDGLVTAIRDGRIDERLPLPGVHHLASGEILATLPPLPIGGGAVERRLSLVLRMTPDGAVIDTVYAVSTAVLNDHSFVEWPRPGTRIPSVAIGTGGVVAVAGASSEYRIDVLRADLTDSLAICRQAPALPLTESETGDVELPGAPPGLARLLEASRKVKPVMPLGRIFFGQNGRLWVQRERPDPQRIYAQPGGAAYDVFAAGGDYLGEVRAPDGVLLIGEAQELVYGIQPHENGFLDLVTFSLD